MHSLTEELVRDPFKGDLDFGYFWVVEGLGVASEGLLPGHVLEEHQDPLRAACGHVKIYIPKGVALVFSVPQNLAVQDREAAIVLICDHASQLWLSDNFVLQN